MLNRIITLFIITSTILMFSLFAFHSVNAQSDEMSATTVKSLESSEKEIKTQKDIVQQKSLEIEVLKAQLNEMKAFRSDFVSIIIWSLGGITGIVLILALFSWFRSREFYKNDLKNIEIANQQFVEKKLNEANGKLIKYIHETTEKNLAYSKLKIQKLEDDLTQQIKDAEDDLTQQIKNTENDLTQKIKDAMVGVLIVQANINASKKLYQIAIDSVCKAGIMSLTIKSYDYIENIKTILNNLNLYLPHIKAKDYTKPGKFGENFEKGLVDFIADLSKFNDENSNILNSELSSLQKAYKLSKTRK